MDNSECKLAYNAHSISACVQKIQRKNFMYYLEYVSDSKMSLFFFF